MFLSIVTSFSTFSGNLFSKMRVYWFVKDLTCNLHLFRVFRTSESEQTTIPKRYKNSIAINTEVRTIFDRFWAPLWRPKRKQKGQTKTEQNNSFSRGSEGTRLWKGTWPYRQGFGHFILKNSAIARTWCIFGRFGNGQAARKVNFIHFSETKFVDELKEEFATTRQTVPGTVADI